MKPCKACQNATGNLTHVAREMMLGRRTEFGYQECARCGSLQIQEVPPDLANYYPSSYYSFQKPGALKSFLKRQWASHTYRHSSLIGRLLSVPLGENPSLAALRQLNLQPHTAILDVGCGSGDLLLDLASLGFQHLRGVDPYNSEEIRFNGIIIWNTELSAVPEQFDLIMFHHSLEHMEEPRQVFRDTAKLLKPGGTVLIRVPVAGCFAWREYQRDWVQLDAPRHLFIPSAKAIQILADEFGFTLVRTVYDSTEFQFWGSEQYKQDVSLSDKESHQKKPVNLLFPNQIIREYRRRAEELNRQAQGDQACFFLQRK